MKWISKLIGIVGILSLVCVTGCSTTKDTEEKEYSRCSATSQNDMAEIEAGFFHEYNNILYYADKNDMDVWVPVCNKPNCMHTSEEMTCNAYLPFGDFVEKDGKLYGSASLADGRPFIYETAIDGSGWKKIYEIPFEENVFINHFKPMLSQNQLVIYYSYLQEDGMRQYGLARLQDDTFYIVYAEEHEDELAGAIHMPAKSIWSNRGDDFILSGFLSQTDWLNTLWRMDGEEPEQLILPEGVSPKFSYVSGDEFLYFKEKEGFYQLNLDSGEQKLISECHSQDSIGYVLSKEYMVEFNRYVGYTPENAYLKFYNGKQWIYVEMPDEIKESNCQFAVKSLASDRIFFVAQNNEEGTEKMYRLYYFMIEENKPQLIPCFDVEFPTLEGESAEKGSEESIEEITKESVEENIEESVTETTNENDTEEKVEKRIEISIGDEKEIVVFDTENYVLKITDMYARTSYEKGAEEGKEKEYKTLAFDVYWENKTSNKMVGLFLTSASVNGIQCNTDWGIISQAGDSSLKEGAIHRLDISMDTLLQYYEPTEMTDIELHFGAWGNGLEEECVIQIYPYGEQASIAFARKEQETDYVVFDNESTKIIVLGYESQKLKNDTVYFFVENKTDEMVTLTIREAYANGVDLDVREDWEKEPIHGTCSSFVRFSLADNYLTDSKMKEIGTIEELELKIKLYSNYNEVDSMLINESIKLEP